MAVVLAACGGNGDTPDGAPDAGTVASPGPTLTVQVSNDGNDLHDGIDQPVQTLKRAIAIAAANRQVTDIVLAAGSYMARDGETFPYTVPDNLQIVGPLGGGAFLVGTGGETGLIFKRGQLHNVELDNFAVAIESVGDLVLRNLRVAGSTLAVKFVNPAKLRVTNLDIAGPENAIATCAVGIRIENGADLIATTLTARHLLHAVDAPNGGTIDIAKANIISTLPPLAECGGVTMDHGSAFEISAQKAFTLSDSVIDGGSLGIDLVGRSSTNLAPATITSTTLRNLSSGVRASKMALQMTDSTITNNNPGGSGDGLDARDGTWSLSRVTIAMDVGTGIFMRGLSATEPAALTMRFCTVRGTLGGGIQMFDYVTADLGTSSNPGHNVIVTDSSVGLRINGGSGQTQIDAVGNTWRQNVQGSDAIGGYSTNTILGPIFGNVGDNFSIASGWRLQL